jgi:hypothetical protein
LLLQAPLKLTLLANVSETQSDVAASEIEEWLLPSRSELRACSPLAQAAARRGAIELGNSEADAREGAYVGVVLGEESPRAARVLELTAFLLNRPGGFLEQSFASPKLAATARAHALGGARRPALVIDIRALPQDLPEGIARVRSVLERMAVGGVTPAEFKFAEAELDRRDALARLDPRRRIVELWRNTRIPPIDLAVLRSIHASLRGPSHWIVQVKPGS